MPRFPVRDIIGAMATTLCLDIGGTGLKAALVGENGDFMSERARVDTPHPLTPELLVSTLADLARPLGRWDRVAAGFPGVIRGGIVRTAPNLGTERFRGFDLAGALSAALGAPARVANDADVQGLAAIEGRGVEMVITLGTGFGSALFEDGRLAPHLELAHHPFRKKQTYEEALGDAALEKEGMKTWKKRLRRCIKVLRALTDFDHLYIGGGNARHLDQQELPDDVTLVPNSNGLVGGLWLWKER